MATLVDTNVLIDIAGRDPVWLKWSRSQLEKARRRGSVVINQVIFAEFSIRYETLEQVESVLPEDEFRRESLPFEAAFAAGKPILTSVSSRHRDAWLGYAPGAVELPADEAAIERWWRALDGDAGPHSRTA